MGAANHERGEQEAGADCQHKCGRKPDENHQEIARVNIGFSLYRRMPPCRHGYQVATVNLVWEPINAFIRPAPLIHCSPDVGSSPPQPPGKRCIHARVEHHLFALGRLINYLRLAMDLGK